MDRNAEMFTIVNNCRGPFIILWFLSNSCSIFQERKRLVFSLFSRLHSLAGPNENARHYFDRGAPRSTVARDNVGAWRRILILVISVSAGRLRGSFVQVRSYENLYATAELQAISGPRLQRQDSDYGGRGEGL